MNQIFAILASSYHEARAQRSFLVLLILGLPVILFCFGLSIQSPKPVDSLRFAFSDLNKPSYNPVPASAPETTVVSIEPVTSHLEHSFAPEFDGGHVVTLDVSDPADLRSYGNAAMRSERDQTGDTRDVSVRFLEHYGRESGFSIIEAVPDMERPERFYVAAHSLNAATRGGGAHVSIFFGAWTIPADRDSAATIITRTQSIIAQAFTGMLGMLIMLAASSGFIPNLLKRGTVDLMLARPIGRTKLLLSKYLGGLWFVTLVSVAILGACWLGFAFNGFSAPAFLISIPALIFQFAILYTVSTLVGLLTRNGGLAFLASIGVWWFSTLAYQLTRMVDLAPDEFSLPSSLQTIAKTVYNVLPKIKEIDLLAVHWMAQAQGAEGTLFEARHAADINPTWVFGSSLVFGVVCLGLAIWRFYKRDG